VEGLIRETSFCGLGIKRNFILHLLEPEFPVPSTQKPPNVHDPGGRYPKLSGMLPRVLR